MSNPYEKLKGVFHEPNRMAIVSELIAASHGITFGELKDKLNLTEGNLSRHLKTLQDEKIIKIKKEFISSKPRTTVSMTQSGQDDFLDYLSNLEAALKQASLATKPDKKKNKKGFVIPLRIKSGSILT